MSPVIVFDNRAFFCVIPNPGGVRERVRISSHSVCKIPIVLRCFIKRLGEVIFAGSLSPGRNKIAYYQCEAILTVRRFR